MIKNSYEGDHLLIARFAHLRMFPSMAEYGVVHRLGPKLEMGILALLIERMLQLGFTEENVNLMVSEALKFAREAAEAKTKKEAADSAADSATQAIPPLVVERPDGNVVTLNFGKKKENKAETGA